MAFVVKCKGDDEECLDPVAYRERMAAERAAREAEERLNMFGGIDLAAREAELARLALLEKYKHLPPPGVKIGIITNKGEMKLGFNQAMTVPED